MKYFTTATLTLLTLNSLLLAVGAASTARTPDAVTHEHSFIGDLSRAGDQLVQAVKAVFVTPKKLIEPVLEVPRPLDTSSIVQISPCEELCQVGSASQFWNALFKRAEGPENVEKVIFCPGAISYLKELDSGKLLKNAKGDKLRFILSALMLRRVTLIGKYSESYMEGEYLTCYDALWYRVRSTNPEDEFWPCSNTGCDGEVIKASFSKFADSNPSCTAVLKDQLAAYAENVAKVATSNKIASSIDLREAIIENLNSAPHLLLPIYAVYDSVLEADKKAAVKQIDTTLDYAKGILETLTEGSSTVYADAETCFKSRLGGIEADRIKAAAAEARSKAAITSNVPAITSNVPAVTRDVPAVTSTSAPVDSPAAEPKSPDTTPPTPPTETDKIVTSKASEAADPTPKPTTKPNSEAKSATKTA